MERALKNIYEELTEFFAEAPDYKECSDNERELMEELANVRDAIENFLDKGEV